MTEVGSDSEPFEIQTKSFPFSVPAGVGREVLIRYTASLIGLETGSVSIRSNSADQPEAFVTIQAAGSDGQTPRIRLEREMIGFPVVAVGDTSTSKIAIGNASLVVLDVEWELNGQDAFSATASGPMFTLGGGDRVSS